MFKLLSIRYIQIKRVLSGAGPSIVLLGGLLWMLIYLSYQSYQDSTDAYVTSVLLFSVCLAIQIARKDKDFVFAHIDKPKRALYAEYVALTLPFAFSSLLSKHFYCFFILYSSLLAIPYLRYTFRRKPYFKRITKLVPAKNIEWVSGFRKNFIFLIPLYLLAFALSWFRIAPLILLWLITFVVLGFYNEYEPLIILRANSIGGVALLKTKMKTHSIIIIVLYLPIVALNSIFNPEYLEINALFLFGQVALICFCICLKYSNYYPLHRQMGNSIILALVVLASLIPFLFPITILMCIDYYSKAKVNLKNYIND